MTTTKTRDAKLFKAVQDFFREEGDTHEFESVVDDAIDLLELDVLGFTTKLLSLLRTKNGITTIGQLRRMTYEELVALPGIGHTYARPVSEAMSVFKRTLEREVA